MKKGVDKSKSMNGERDSKECIGGGGRRGATVKSVTTLATYWSSQGDARSVPSQAQSKSTATQMNRSINHGALAMKASRIHRAVWTARIVFVSFLVLVAAITGYLLHSYLRGNEIEVAQHQFAYMSERALNSALDIVNRKRMSMITMAAIISEQLANETSWPFVTVHGYERIVTQLAATASHAGMGFAPIIMVEDQQEWENYAYEYFDSRPDHYPNGTGRTNGFETGIWRLENGTKVHDNDSSTKARRFLTPIFQCCVDNPGDPVHLFNLHSEVNRRNTIDGIVNCVENLKRTNNRTYPEGTCGTTTDFLRIVRFEHRGPASILFQPVFPANDPTFLGGLVLSPLVWDEMFENAFHEDMDGVHCVLESETQVHTYIITHGIVESFHEGDLHQEKYTSLGRIRNLTSMEQHAMGVPMYKLRLYPSDNFYLAYQTKNPRNATVVALVVIVVTSLLFLLYDSFVRHEFRERKNVLEAKRRFMRYVSHEVRTPLNAVVMGLSVVELELQALFDAGAFFVRDTSSVDSIAKGDADNDDNNNILKGKECMRLLSDIQGSAQSAVEVLNNVLQYDKIERSTLKLEIEILPIWNLLDKTIAEFKLPAAREMVHLKIAYGVSASNNGREVSDVDLEKCGPHWVSSVEDLPKDILDLRIAGDSSRIAQVVRNLLSNALKFTPQNGTVLVQADFQENIDARCHQETIKLKDGQEALVERRGTLRLRVTDTGAGMSEDELAKVFGEGVQFNVNELQAGKGSGLGLFITKGIVQQHRGELLAESGGKGKGCVFTAAFPAYQVPTENDSISSQETGQLESRNSFTASGDSQLVSPPSETLKLLIVDDVLSNRKLTSRLLTNKGHECDVAENGAVAVEMVRDSMINSGNHDEPQRRPYDCVLMDFEMPVMNGPTATAEIRALGSDVFIVGITGNVLSEDVEYFKSEGANAVIPKPLQVSALEELWMEYSVK